MNRLLLHYIGRLASQGNLKVTGPDNITHSFGDGSGPPVHVEIRNRRAEWAMTLDPHLALPESYMNGSVGFREGDVLGLLRIIYTSAGVGSDTVGWAMKWVEGLRYLFRRLQQFNTIGRAKDNVRRHYDLSGEIYRLFLDKDMQYSCAYFETPQMSLEEAQLAKKRHIVAKLNPRPELRILDIGSGWGGLGLYMARHMQAQVLGVTLSTEQHALSNERAAQEELAGRARFELRDYRTLEGPFDRIVSVGMFEHVGVGHYRTYFRKCADLLERDGVMLLHSIGRMRGPSVTNAFIRKHIFPGGYIPALSEVIPAIERSGLMIADIEILRLHYAETLRHWRERFMAGRDRAIEIYDERFARMWEFYLAASEASFRWSDLMVFQIQLTHARDAVPLTRNYMVETENRLRGRDGKPDGHYREAAE